MGRWQMLQSVLVVMCMAAAPAVAQDGGERRGMQGPGMSPGMHGPGMEQGGLGMRGKGGHGSKGQGMRGGSGWRATLSDDQRQQLMRLKVEQARNVLPLKARARAYKAELAALATADAPDQQAIDTAINELATLKREILTHKYRFIAEQRKLLTPEQRPMFDMGVLRRAGHRGGGGSHGEGGHGGGGHGGGGHGGGGHGGGGHGGGHGGGGHGGHD